MIEIILFYSVNIKSGLNYHVDLYRILQNPLREMGHDIYDWLERVYVTKSLESQNYSKLHYSVRYIVNNVDLDQTILQEV